ncbi:WxL protein peptidoglycan domain-containing protein [Actinokineospora sp. NPDC004072]
MSRIPRLLLALVIAALALVLPGTAQADDPVTWGVRPADSAEFGASRPNYSYVADPGSTIRDAIAITNRGDRPITLLVYAADGFTTASGQLDVLPRGQRSVDLGAWVTPARERVEIPARGAVEVPFTIAVPADAEPGDHSGGILTSLAVAEQADGVTVDRRLGSRIHLRVSGEAAPALAVENLVVDYHGTTNPFGLGSATVSFRVANTGNLRVSAEQQVRVEGLFGLGGREQALTVPELLPGSHLDFSVPVADVAPLLRLEAAVKLVLVVEDNSATAQPAEVTATASTWAVPWTLLALLVAAVGLVVLLRVRARRRAAATERRIAEAVAEARGGATAE